MRVMQIATNAAHRQQMLPQAVRPAAAKSPRILTAATNGRGKF